jgi:cytochrome d ubiquinol oxidase subunit II
MFAAFPAWYATLFSGLYIPLFLVLLGLIIRGVSFEYRAKRPDTKWRNTFDWMSCIGSFLVALVFGVGFANFIIGLPVALAPKSEHLYVVTRGLWGLFSPFGLLGGIVLVVLFLFHGANYLALKTKGTIQERARAFSAKVGLVGIAGGAVYLIWANLAYGWGVLGWILTVLAALGLVASWWLGTQGRDGWAFIATTATTLFVAVWIFGRMFPNLGFDNSAVKEPLSIATASSTGLTLQIMTVAACVFVPIVLTYTGWGYWINRKRISELNIPDEAPEPTPAY